MIPYGKQKISEQDIEAVIDVLRSDFLTQGKCVLEFEKKITDYCGAQYGVAVNSATSALHLACLALNLSKKSLLWTSPVTFVASSNCAFYCDADVDFVDIDVNTYNICIKKLSEKLKRAKIENKLPDILVVVHIAGQSCNMKSIHELSIEYGFRIIEDASHAIGGKYCSESIGNCRYSDIAIFSFHPVKIITTAEGGIAVTNNNKIADKMRLLRSHGITRDFSLMTREPDGPWYYQQIDLGFNYRMTDIQAALGCSQLTQLDNFVTRRHELANHYNSILKDLPLILPYQNNDSYSSYHLYIVRIKLEYCKLSHRDIFEQLLAKGVGVNLHYIPIHLQPYYQKRGFRNGQYPNAEHYYHTAITLPLFPDLMEKDQLYIKDQLSEILL